MLEIEDALKLVTEPTVEPISLEEFKLDRRIENEETSEDTKLEMCIKAAREYCERFTRRSFINTVWDYTLDAFPCREISLPRSPLVSVDEVTYTTEEDEEVTLDDSAYLVNLRREPGIIVPAYGTVWPSTVDLPERVRVQFTAGYGETAAFVPASIKQAILLLAGHYYENREENVVGTITSKLEHGIKNLLHIHRVMELR